MVNLFYAWKYIFYFYPPKVQGVVAGHQQSSPIVEVVCLYRSLSSATSEDGTWCHMVRSSGDPVQEFWEQTHTYLYLRVLVGSIPTMK